jgi:hypothetical protein
MVKGFGLSIEYVLYEMSFANLLMYNAVIPSYNSDKDGNGKSKDNTVVDADKEPEKARKIMFGE